MTKCTVILDKGACMEHYFLVKKLELEEAAYYEKLAAETPVFLLKDVFSLIAKEKLRHHAIFEALELGQVLPLIDTKNLIDNMLQDVIGKVTVSFSQHDTIYDHAAAYEKALRQEEKSIFLCESMRTSLLPMQLKTLEVIIGQKKAHANVMGALLELIHSPKTWLENAEWRHADVY